MGTISVSMTGGKPDAEAMGRIDVRTIGDFVLRMAYHELVHTGQLLSYLRRMNVPRPEIWD